MKPEIKERWLEALRSGKYTYCHGSLKEVEVDGSIRHCTLGVLCDIYSQQTGIPWDDVQTEISDERPRRVTYLGMLSSLEDEILDWAGITGFLVTYRGVDGEPYTIASLSDDSKCYDEPIEAIERYL